MYDDTAEYAVIHAVTQEVGRVFYHDYARSMLYVLVQTSSRTWEEKQWSRLLCSRYDGHIASLSEIFGSKRKNADVIIG